MIRITSKLKRLLTQSLSESLETGIMVKIIRRIIPIYDVYKQSGFPENIPMPTQDAANQIVNDIIREGHFINFITVLIDVYQNGLMGKKIQITLLPQILKEMEIQGLVYDPKARGFIENANQQRTKGWGILHEGRSYDFTFLRLDIVGNTRLVREYPNQLILDTYSDLKTLVKRLVEKRNGRIWDWQGDGGIAAWHFNDKNSNAVLTGMEILYELFLYNLFSCKLAEPLNIRMASHNGPCQFSTQEKSLHNETLKKLEILESRYSKPNTLTISPGVYSDLGGKLEKAFQQSSTGPGNSLYTYQLRWED